MAHVAPPASGVNVVTSGPAPRAILRLALPTVAAMLTQSIVNEVDILFFARLPTPESSNAQAALLPSLILLWGLGGSLSAISVGTQAYTGRRFAERRYGDAGAVLANAAFFALVSGVVASVIGYLVMPTLLTAIVKLPGAREAAAQYLHWRLLGIVSMVMTFAFKAFFDGIGKTHIHFISAVIMNALNVLLCWILIFGRPELGIPKMGIGGAGLAGFIATYLGLAIMIGYALKEQYRTRFRPFAASKLSRALTWDLLKLSIPSGVATAAVMTGVIIFAATASLLDKVQPAAGADQEPVYAAATTVVVGILKLTFTACLAFGTSTATLVAQSLGERDGEKAANFGWTSVRLGLAIFGVVGLLEAIFAPNILRVAASSDLVRQAALAPMRVMGVLTPIIAVGMILTQALFGAGNTRFVMVVELVLHFTCLVPLAYLLGIKLHLGIMGIWSAGVVYAILLASVMTWKFRLGDWKRIHL